MFSLIFSDMDRELRDITCSGKMDKDPPAFYRKNQAIIRRDKLPTNIKVLTVGKIVIMARHGNLS